VEAAATAFAHLRFAATPPRHPRDTGETHKLPSNIIASRAELLDGRASTDACALANLLPPIYTTHIEHKQWRSQTTGRTHTAARTYNPYTAGAHANTSTIASANRDPISLNLVALISFDSSTPASGPRTRRLHSRTLDGADSLEEAARRAYNAGGGK
jgi:hypothetical protein